MSLIIISKQKINQYFVFGWTFEPKRRGELHPVQRQHPQPSTSVLKILQANILKVTRVEHKLIILTHERWQMKVR